MGWTGCFAESSKTAAPGEAAHGYHHIRSLADLRQRSRRPAPFSQMGISIVAARIREGPTAEAAKQTKSRPKAASQFEPDDRKSGTPQFWAPTSTGKT